MKSAAKFPSIVSAAPLLVIALLAVTPSSHGQTTTNPRSPNTPYPGMPSRPTVQQPSVREREFIMRSLETEAGQPKLTEEAKLTLSQIARDYSQIQSINNTMLSATIPAPEPDYARIEDSTVEIKGCASRLKKNLGLAKIGNDPVKGKPRRSALNADDVKADLLSLDRLIMRFVQNPIFDKLDVLNVEHATKARADLEAIMDLSQSINKDSQRLKKSAKKS
ncbi:MAG TPA: hypothetical protein VJU86_01890 [Pyrinomonadaceae bacterium]|nr:hypothetical protein [Pyrinomonadaceae bacterium]